MRETPGGWVTPHPHPTLSLSAYGSAATQRHPQRLRPEPPRQSTGRSTVSHGLNGGCGVNRARAEALGFDALPRATAEDALAEAVAFFWAFAEAEAAGAAEGVSFHVQAVVLLLGDGVAVSVGVHCLSLSIRLITLRFAESSEPERREEVRRFRTVLAHHGELGAAVAVRLGTQVLAVLVTLLTGSEKRKCGCQGLHPAARRNRRRYRCHRSSADAPRKRPEPHWRARLPSSTFTDTTAFAGSRSR